MLIPTAKITRREPDGEPDRKDDALDEDSDRQREPASVHQAAQRVPPKLVGSKRVTKLARTGIDVFDLLRDRPDDETEMHQQRRNERDEDEKDQQHRTGDSQRAA